MYAALSSATEHAMPQEFGGEWGMECLNTKFPLPTLLCAGYSMKLIYFYLIYTENEGSRSEAKRSEAEVPYILSFIKLAVSV